MLCRFSSTPRASSPRNARALSGSSLTRPDPGIAARRPSRVPIISRSSVTSRWPASTNDAASVDFPYVQSPRNPIATSPIATTAACSGSNRCRTSAKDSAWPNRKFWSTPTSPSRNCRHAICDPSAATLNSYKSRQRRYVDPSASWRHANHASLADSDEGEMAR